MAVLLKLRPQASFYDFYRISFPWKYKYKSKDQIDSEISSLMAYRRRLWRILRSTLYNDGFTSKNYQSLTRADWELVEKEILDKLYPSKPIRRAA